jgi:hypothetical protein
MSDTPEVPKPTEGWGSLPAEIREAIEQFGRCACEECEDALAVALLPLVRDRERMEPDLNAMAKELAAMIELETQKPQGWGMWADWLRAKLGRSVPGGETV